MVRVFPPHNYNVQPWNGIILTILLGSANIIGLFRKRFCSFYRNPQQSVTTKLHLSVTSSRLDLLETFFSIFAAVFSAPFTFFSFLPFLPISAQMWVQIIIYNNNKLSDFPSQSRCCMCCLSTQAPGLSFRWEEDLLPVVLGRHSAPWRCFAETRRQTRKHTVWMYVWLLLWQLIICTLAKKLICQTKTRNSRDINTETRLQKGYPCYFYFHLCFHVQT